MHRRKFFVKERGVQRILQPGEIEALDKIEFPRIRLPQPATLFQERAARLRQRMEGNSIAEYLGFVAKLADQQALAAAKVLTLPVPETAIATALQHGMPAMPAVDSLDPAWRQVLKEIAAAISKDASLPEAVTQTAEALLTRDDDALDALARHLLDGEVSVDDVAAQPIIMAALQVVFADRASRLDHKHIAYVDPATICPVCGSEPVASVQRIGGEAGGYRYLHCGVCETEWHMVRVKCTHCESTKGIRYQGIEGGDKALLAETCDECHTYRKVVNQEKDPYAEPLADDLASLTLDLLMADTPYARASGNPMLALVAQQGDADEDEGSSSVNA
jgi:FdhE protein